MTQKQDMICIWKWQWCESSSSQECMLDIFYGKKIFIAIVSHVWLRAWSPEENMSFKLFCLTSKAAQSKMFDFQSYFIMSQKEEVTACLYKVKEDFVIYHYRATCKDIIWKEGMTLPGVA